MSNLTDFVFDSPIPSLIINKWSDGGRAASTPEIITTGNSLPILSGVLTADTPKEILSVTGLGKISYLAVVSVSGDTTSRLIGCTLTIDGQAVPCFDAISGAVTAGLAGPVVTAYPVYFNSSFTIDISSSISETDKVVVYISYEVY